MFNKLALAALAVAALSSTQVLADGNVRWCSNGRYQVQMNTRQLTPASVAAIIGKTAGQAISPTSYPIFVADGSGVILLNVGATDVSGPEGLLAAFEELKTLGAPYKPTQLGVLCGI